MPKYSVYGVVTGGKYLGVFEAENKEAAEEMAMNSEAAQISFCHHCSRDCEDPQILEFAVEEVTD